MTEKDVGEYRDRVKKIVSRLKENGEKVKEEDIAYTILMGLGPRYFALVVTLLNTKVDELLILPKVTDAILTEDMRLKELHNDAGKGDSNTTDPLAYQSDNSVKGTLQYQPTQPTNQSGYTIADDIDIPR